MAKKHLIRLAVILSSAILSATMLAYSPAAAYAGSIESRMDTFTNPDGINYFAVSLKPEGIAAAEGPRDVIVLFNTSAGQTGEFRDKALEVLQNMISGMPEGYRVQLMAMDLNANSMTKTFVDPKSKEMADAMIRLKDRAPLGASDMKKALTAAAGGFSGEPKNPRAIIYIGDGRSAAKFLTAQESDDLINKLVENRISMDSYLIGPRVDMQIAGALAGQTGGMVISDSADTTAAQAGEALNAAAGTAVMWPQSVIWPEGFAEVFPKHAPPLRGDRDTVLIGTYKGEGPFEIQYPVETPGGAEKLNAVMKPGISDDANNYLMQAVEYARQSGGATLPLAGSASLEQLRAAVGAGEMGIKALARQALASGNLDGAEKLIGEALRQDPNDTEAKAMKGALAKKRQGNGSAGIETVISRQPTAGGEGELNLVDPAAVINDPQAGVLAEGFQQEHRIIAQAVQAEVVNAINQARKQMSSEPDAASENLRLMLQNVQNVADLNPDVRDQLSEQLRTALREAARRKVEVEFHRQQQQESMAAARERQLITDNLLRDQQKLKQLMERFDSMMDEAKYQVFDLDQTRYRQAEEQVADEAVKNAAVAAANGAAENPVPLQAATFSRTLGYYTGQMAVRLAGQKAFVDTMYLVNKDAIPFPDDPPIVYPSAEIWQQLTIRRKDKYSSMDLAKTSPAEKKIKDALKSETKMEFVDTPLNQVVDFLKNYHGIEIQLDTRVLTEAGVNSDTPVSIDLKGITLKSALRLMLKNLGDLTYVIQDEVLLITTQDEANSRLVTKAYPVADLVIPVQANMGGGMGGGMMGGMGGGGGMMGGMGGGMGGGGMGGGMGGGGMFNVPHELLPLMQRQMLQKIPAGGFQAFAVKDDLSQPAKGNEPAGGNVPAKNAAAAEKIPIDIAAGVNAEQYWEKYFSAHLPQPAAVRDAVRRLMKDKKYDQVIAMIDGALRHRQAQPWMYEAMSLAMQAAGRPKEEIERVVMSAVDFCDNTADLTYIGTYLMKLGLKERALDIFRQASQQDAIRPEPYILGLKAARELNDMDGLRWASLGILNQAWTKDHEQVWQAGVGVAKEIYQRMKANKQDKEAEAFEAELDQAVARDCVVAVHWTGDADVDLIVEEPSGAVCSLRNPRTAGGGVMLGDVLSQTGSDNSGGHSEVYVCPKGFDGAYRLKAWRVWGKVNTGKVTVEITTHFRDKNPITVSKILPLEKDEVLATFDLKDGRRKESLREQQIANAADGQLAVNQQILAQQITAAIDPHVLGNLASGQSSGTPGSGFDISGGGVAAGQFIPFARGAVGYQPVIALLPAGASLSATAVVSADRRYVRVSCTPFFSGIGQVTTFNTSTGGTGTSSGSASGAGGSGIGSGGNGISSGGGGSSSGSGSF